MSDITKTGNLPCINMLVYSWYRYCIWYTVCWLLGHPCEPHVDAACWYAATAASCQWLLTSRQAPQPDHPPTLCKDYQNDNRGEIISVLFVRGLYKFDKVGAISKLCMSFICVATFSCLLWLLQGDYTLTTPNRGNPGTNNTGTKELFKISDW